MSTKHTYGFIKEQIENQGHVLHSKRYENSHTNLLIESPEGELFKMRWSTFQQGKRCPETNRKGAGKPKYHLDFIKKEINKVGFRLISKRYKNAHSFLKIKCKLHGHEFRRLWDDIYNKNCITCPECRKKGY